MQLQDWFGSAGLIGVLVSLIKIIDSVFRWFPRRKQYRFDIVDDERVRILKEIGLLQKKEMTSVEQLQLLVLYQSMGMRYPVKICEWALAFMGENSLTFADKKLNAFLLSSHVMTPVSKPFSLDNCRFKLHWYALIVLLALSTLLISWGVYSSYLQFITEHTDEKNKLVFFSFFVLYVTLGVVACYLYAREVARLYYAKLFWLDFKPYLQECYKKNIQVDTFKPFLPLTIVSVASGLLLLRRLWKI